MYLCLRLWVWYLVCLVCINNRNLQSIRACLEPTDREGDKTGRIKPGENLLGRERERERERQTE